jgi:hypothetical protein
MKRRGAAAWPLGLLAGIACGALVWALSVPLTGYPEPFDCQRYYWPAMLIAGALAALPAPQYWWLAVVGVFIGERVYGYAALPEMTWLLFGVIVNALMLTWLPAAIGAAAVYVAHRQLIRRSTQTSADDRGAD